MTWLAFGLLGKSMNKQTNEPYRPRISLKLIEGFVSWQVSNLTLQERLNGHTFHQVQRVLKEPVLFTNYIKGGRWEKGGPMGVKL